MINITIKDVQINLSAPSYIVLNACSTEASSLNYNENISFKQIFQQLNYDTIFLVCEKEMLPTLFNLYLDSVYNFKGIIPWVKINFNDTELLNVTYRLKNCVSFILVFQKPKGKNLRPYLPSLIIEPEYINYTPKWEIELAKKLSFMEGIMLNGDKLIASKDLLKSANTLQKTKLFT